MRGTDPDPRRGGGNCTGPRGSRNIGAQSGDARSCADGDPAGNTDRDHCTQCCNNIVTSQLTDPGGHVRTDTSSGDTHSGPGAGTGDPDTGTNVYPDPHGGDPNTDTDPSTDEERPDAGSNSSESSAHVGFHEAKGKTNTNTDAADQHPNAGSHPDAGPNG